jgi:hypothetical protein
MKIIKKGPTLMGFFLQKGWTLMDFPSEQRVCPLQSWKDRPYWIFLDPNEVFFPSSKLSPGLSNQPKPPIYLFWQSQSQIANLPSIL